MVHHLSEVLNPLSGTPLLGYLVTLVDGIAAQIGITFWLRTFFELVLAGIGCYALLRLITRRVIPWLATILVRPVVELMELLRVFLLLPDLGISRVTRGFGRAPHEVVYAYGTAVMTVADRLQGAARAGLPALAITRRIHGLVLVGVLVLSFLVWNSQTCATGDGKSCTSPVTQWTASFKASLPSPTAGK
ncbi:MAG TPA: hypothetical protein VGL80_32040 [Pseudonocardiaceae bacterium]|jgi:hypothetical protein